MATLWIREGYQAEFERKICSYTDKITEINDQFYKTSKIIEVYSGDPNVNSCNVYLDKRRSDLSNALHSAEELKRKANSYVDQVIGADISVSKSIHKESYEFYQKKGIGPQNDSWGAHLWNSVKTTVSDFVHDVESTKNKIIQDIKEFYEKSKYIFNVIGDFLAVAAAVALFSLAATSGLIGILCLIGAIWATSKAMYELITDCLAVEAWLNGDTP